MGLVGHLLVDLPALLLGTLLANRPLGKVRVGSGALGTPYAPEVARNPGLADPEALVLTHTRAPGAAGDLVAVLVGLPVAGLGRDSIHFKMSQKCSRKWSSNPKFENATCTTVYPIDPLKSSEIFSYEEFVKFL